MASFDSEYTYAGPLTDGAKKKLQEMTRAQLTEMLGVEVDDVMAEYVTVMISNKKNMGQICHDLIDFIGEESAEQFIQWLSKVLPSLDSNADGKGNTDNSPTESTSVPVASTQPKNSSCEPPKEVVSLHGITSRSSTSKSNESDASRASTTEASSSGSKPTLRSLKGKAESEDLRAVLKRRAERFGVVRPESPKKNSRKRKASADGEGDNGVGRRQHRNPVEKRLGPPVKGDADQVEEEDSREQELSSANRRKKSRRQDGDGQDNRGMEPNHRRHRDRKGSHPRNSSDGSGKDNGPPIPGDEERGRHGRGGPRGPPGPWDAPPGYGGFPPHPYGGPPMYFPPPYGPPMHPYEMGFHPHGMPQPRGLGGHPAPYGPMGQGGPRGMPRGLRPFQNKKWVNPNTAKKEDASEGEGATGASESPSATQNGGSNDANSTSAPPLNANAPTFAPRNPFYNSQMRPRFQNKTWVRPDPQKEAELSESLPKTPPQHDGQDE